MSARSIDVVWVALMIATVLTWLIGRMGQLSAAMVIAVLSISGIKGWLIIQDFMALRHVGFLWRALMLGWLLATLAIILLAYWIGLTK